MKIEIKSWMNGSVLFSLETETLKLCLEAAIKSGANLRGANLGGADLGRADLRDANLRDANLRDANLRDANLRDANLRDANLRDANLGGADLGRADLRDANLRDANLGDANLRGANLRGANLGDANLGGADLGRADLRDADLRDANLRDAKGVEKFPIQILGHKHVLQTTQDGSLRIGCEEHTFDEWREIAEELGQENGYSALDVEIYKLHIEHIAKVSQLLWNQKKEASA